MCDRMGMENILHGAWKRGSTRVLEGCMDISHDKGQDDKDEYKKQKGISQLSVINKVSNKILIDHVRKLTDGVTGDKEDS